MYDPIFQYRNRILPIWLHQDKLTTDHTPRDNERNIRIQDKETITRLWTSEPLRYSK